jgi:site-specific DNA-methyltransferase (adenine-specific)
VRPRSPRAPKASAAPPAPLVARTGHGGAPLRLYRIDALEGFEHLTAPGSVDVVVTSPPYNLGVAYAASDDRRPREEYLAWMGRVGAAVDRALSPQGSFFLNVGGPPRDPTLPWAIAERVRSHLTLQNVIHWVKSIAIDRASVGQGHGLSRDLAVGHYKPIRSDRFLHGAHEYIFHFTHGGNVRLDRLAVGVPYEDASNVGRWRSSGAGLRCRGNTWFLPYRTIRYRATDRPHPATFPPELPERCFRLHGLSRIGLAVDPFVGIGSSAVAAARLGIPFLGFDVAEEYLREAARRLDGVAPRTTGPPAGVPTATGPVRGTAPSRTAVRGAART